MKPKLRKGLSLIKVAVALVSLAVTSNAYAQSSRPFEIALDTSGPITLDWNSLRKVPKVVGINNTTLKEVKLRVDLGGFIRRDGQPVDLSAHLSVEPNEVTLPAAGIGYVRITAANASLPPDIQTGNHTGFLTISESSGLFRKQITIASSDSPKMLTPSAGRVVVRVWRWSPLPVFSGLWGESFSLPLKQKAAVVPPGTPGLFYLSRNQGGSAFARLTEEQKAIQDEKEPSVQLTIGGVKHAGQYDGTINLTPRLAGVFAEPSVASQTASSDLPPTITVYVTDIIVWPILVIVIGILITQVTKYYFGVKRQIWTWRQGEAELGVSLKQAKQEFSATATKHDLFTVYSIEKNLAERRKVLLDRIRSIDKLSSFSLQDDVAARHVRSVTDELAWLSAKIRAWSQFPMSVIRLRDEMTRAYPLEIAVAARETRAEGLMQLPKIISQCGDAILGGPFDLDAIESRGAELKTWAAVLPVWGRLYRDSISCRRELGRIKACDASAPEGKKLGEKDRQFLDSSSKRLEETLARLWAMETGDHEVIGEIKTSLTSIQESLSSLDAGRELGLASREMSSHSVSAFPIGASLEAPLTDGDTANQVAAYQPLSLIARIRNLKAERTEWRGLRAENDESRAQYYRAQTLKWDRLTVAVAAIITVITGLQANYFGAAFGSLKDYATLFVWAVGSQVAIEAFSNVLGRVFSSLRA